MKNIPLLILLLLSLLSCEKDANKTADNVLFHDFTHDINLTSIDSVVIVSNGPYCVDSKIPYPSEKKVTYALDIDADQMIDFNVSVRHQAISCNYPKCGDFDDYACILDIEGNNSGDSIILVKSKYDSDHVIYKMNDTIKFNINNGVSKWSTLISGGCPPAYGDDLTDSYIGVKKNGYIGWIHLDKIKNGVVLLDYAINQTIGNSIIAGKQY